MKTHRLAERAKRYAGIVFTVVVGSVGWVYAAGPFGVDHRVELSGSGLWNGNIRKGVERQF